MESNAELRATAKGDGMSVVEELQEEERQRLCLRRISDRNGDDDDHSEAAICFPSKATKRSAKPAGRAQMWRLGATIKVICAILLLVAVSAEGIDPVLSGDVEDEGICPMKCACLDSYIQCIKVNLAIAPSRIPKWVESLDLSGNRLTENVNESLTNLPQLKDLRLKKNRLRAMPVFRGLHRLDKLTLSHNQIERVSPEAIAALPRLEHLDLSKNMIKVLAAGAFGSGSILKVVNLDFNQIGRIERGALDGLAEVLDLRLKNNNLVSLSAEIFQRLKQLKKLQLNGNRIETVNGLTFKYLTELRKLHMRNNRIRVLQAGAFHALDNIETLELDNNKIKTISKSWLYNLTSLHTLSLSNNSINCVEIDSWDFVLNLNTLELSNNRLDAIESTTLEKLLELKELHLRNNVIKSIAESSFRYVPNLAVLDLSHNEISWTIEDMKDTFASLTQLKKFDLSSNKIKSVNQQAFTGLKSVEVLDLTGNNITTIQNNAFGDLESVRELLIDSHTLLCDCHLQWLRGWLWALHGTERAGILEKLKPVCYYPVWLRDRQLMDLELTNFTCNDSPKPKIIEEPPKTLLALKGKNLNLTCTATTTDLSELKFQWKRDNVELDPALYKSSALHSRTEFGNSTVASSVLELENVNQKHVGTYQCIVTNKFGSTYSMRNKITVGTLPTFQKVPTNSTVIVGDTIRLDCAVMGEPRASLAWLKDGGNDFPAARERRMHVMPEDYVFFITSAKVQDQGVYSCTAENVVGLVKADATIVVWEAPSFIKPMENKEARPGTSTVIECMAGGSPKPQIKWAKDGEPIDGVSDRYYFARDDQLLVIMDTQARDAGVYECEMANEQGSELGHMLLTVAAPNVLLSARLDSIFSFIIIAVGCVVVTSCIWIGIIYHAKNMSRRRGSGGAPGGPGSGDSGLGGFGAGRAHINNSSMATMLTMGGDGARCAGGGDYARTSLLANNSSNNNSSMGSPLIPANGGPRVNMISSMSEADEALYLQQQHARLMRNVSPVRLNRVENELYRAAEEDTRSCKDSGNGDSAKERNPTSSSSDDDEEMELQMRNRRMHGSNLGTIQRNRLNEYLGQVGAAGKGAPEEVQIELEGGSTVLNAVYFNNQPSQKTGEVLASLPQRGSTFKGVVNLNESSLSNKSNVAYVDA